LTLVRRFVADVPQLDSGSRSDSIQRKEVKQVERTRNELRGEPAPASPDTAGLLRALEAFAVIMFVLLVVGYVIID
jgi:hypothetical protein